MFVALLSVGGTLVAVKAYQHRAQKKQRAKFLRSEWAVDRRSAAGSVPTDPGALTVLWDRIYPYRTQFLVATALGTANVLLDLGRFLTLGRAVDLLQASLASGFARGGILLVVKSAIGASIPVIGLIALYGWTLYRGRVLWRNTGRAVQHQIRVDLYTHVQQLEMSYFHDRSHGESLTVLCEDINQIERAFDGSWELFLLAVNTVVVSGALLMIAPQIVGITLLTMPAMVWIIYALQPKIRHWYREVGERASGLTDRIADNLDGILTLKSFTAEARERDQVRDRSAAYLHASQRAVVLTSSLPPLLESTIVAGSVITILVASPYAFVGSITWGTYTVLMMLQGQLFYPFAVLGSNLDHIERGLTSMARVKRLLDIPIEEESGSESLDLTRVQGDIVFEHVTFAYTPGITVLEDLSLPFPAGKTTAIVGSTGSGKSTLIKLLLRLNRIDGGTIAIDGRDITSLFKTDIRRAIALVSQEACLFHGTVRENIGLGNPAAGMDDIIEAARIADVHDFICTLPDSYDTLVGEHGAKLSGGQRQRLEIARAVLKDAPILILDEATSNLDPNTEAVVMGALKQRLADRTLIIIAHRLASVQHADHIYVLKDGALYEQGSHHELLALQGQYSWLWQRQALMGGDLQ